MAGRVVPDAAAGPRPMCPGPGSGRILPAMPIRVAGAQLNLVVGDLRGNEERIAEAMDWAEEGAADVLLLPELAVTGYPPE
ncbi:MAG: NAD+ synthase, partial [Gammaproteobacteria bacterium]|nr:NAD+ synthase [Gammaproteobacteria bacterium]